MTATTETLPSREATRSWWGDAWLVMTRELLPTVRDPFSVVFGLIQPVVFLALFGPLLAGSVGDTVPGGDVWAWFVPGILVMTTLFGTSTTGANLLFEMQTGAHERLLVTPLARSAQLVGRSWKEMVPIVAQSLVVVVVMLPFGFTFHPAGALLGLLVAIAVRKQDWMFWAVQQTLLFPLLILSGMLLPLETGPRWMQVAADLNPLRYVVDAERALFAGDLASGTALWGAVAAVLTAAVGLLVGVRTLARSAR
jgi:ABC-2 type transport system permease protein